jgi:hypothetical protein
VQREAGAGRAGFRARSSGRGEFRARQVQGEAGSGRGEFRARRVQGEAGSGRGEFRARRVQGEDSSGRGKEFRAKCRFKKHATGASDGAAFYLANLLMSDSHNADQFEGYKCQGNRVKQIVTKG